MKKARNLIALVMVIALTFVAGVGATVAYFMDEDAQVNTFTTGNVAIDLWEDFGDNDATGIEELIPAVGSAQDGTLKNGVEKEVYVENTGSEDAYVRVHIAIPNVLDDGADTFDAGENVLHFNYDEESIGAGLWDWSKTADDNKYVGNWNYYETSINGIKYNVYVVTYGSILPGKELGKEAAVTEDAMSQVYLDKKVTNADITRIKTGLDAQGNKVCDALGDEWKIYVVAEGTQAAGFDDAYQALNESFGTPGAEGYVAPNFLAGEETPEEDEKTWSDTESQPAE